MLNNIYWLTVIKLYISFTACCIVTYLIDFNIMYIHVHCILMFIKSSYFTFVVPLSKHFTQIHKNTKIIYYLKYSSGDKHCPVFIFQWVGVS